MISCRLCLHRNLRPYLFLPAALRNISRLFTYAELDTGVDDSTFPLTVYQCSQCGFVQLIQQLDTAFYNTYIMTSTHSVQAQQLQRDEASLLLSYCTDKSSRVLDIGCGDGAFLQVLYNAGYKEVAGLEPSETFRKCINPSFRVFSDYVTPEIDIGKFSVITCREVLEHIWDLDGFLCGVKKLLTQDGICMIEVPRLEKAQSQNRFYDFFTDHVNYFSETTLRLVLELHGFRVDSIQPMMNDEYNVAICYLQTPSLIEPPTALIKSIQNLMCVGQKVFWGVGGKGLSLLGYIGNMFDLIVDDDPHKIGMYTPVTHQIIHSPEYLWIQKEQISLILISAMAYVDEIIAKIRFQQYCGDIYKLGKNGVEHV